MKRALAKRFNKVLSLVTAFFLALSTFGGALVEPLHALADGTEASITVNVLNKDGSINRILSASGNNQGSFMLAELVEKSTGETVGWNLKQMTPVRYGDNMWNYYYNYNEFPQTVSFGQFYRMVNGSASDINQNNLIDYDPADYTVKWRAYWCDGSRGREWYSLNCYNDFKGDVPKASDSFLGYVMTSETNGDHTELTMEQKDVAFRLNVNYEVPTTITSSLRLLLGLTRRISDFLLVHFSANGPSGIFDINLSSISVFLIEYSL